MKKLTICLLATFLSLTFFPLQSNAATINDPTTLVDPKVAEAAKAEEAKALLLRLDEIKSKDISGLNFTEKKNLRKEVRSINQSLKEIGGGIYISVGAAIVVLLLLIILL